MQSLLFIFFFLLPLSGWGYLFDSSPNTHGQFLFNNTFYLTQDPNHPEISQTEMFQSALEFSHEGAWFSEFVDFRFGGFSRGQGFFAQLPEAYISTQTLTPKYSLGIKKYIVSQADEFWQLGIWNSQSRWDPLRPINYGLSGLFLDFNIGPSHLTGFILGGGIPTTGPTILNKDGKLYANSRWFSSPASELNFRGQLTPVHYTLQLPSFADLIVKPGFGFLSDFGTEDQGFFSRAGIAYKPMNSLSFKYTGLLQLSDNNKEQGQVTIVPYTTHHYIGSFDVGYKNDLASVWVSFLNDDPIEIEIPEGWTVQRFQSAQTWAIGGSLSPFFPKDFRIDLSYLKVQGGRSYEEGVMANPDKSIFGPRIDFQEALQVSVKGTLLRHAHHILTGKGQWIREFQQKGLLLSGEINYYIDQKWSCFLGADVLGVDDTSNNESLTFFNLFRANDRVFTGLNYVF